jgi:quinol monooxygenase YgiN
MGKVSVVARLNVKAEAADDFPKLWEDLLAHVKENEPGTEHYVLHRSTTEPNVFFVTEIYTEQSSLDAHMASDAFTKFGASLGDVVEGGDMFFLEPVAQPKL